MWQLSLISGFRMRKEFAPLTTCRLTLRCNRPTSNSASINSRYDYVERLYDVGRLQRSVSRQACQRHT